MFKKVSLYPIVMKEKTLLRLALGFSLFGILVLYLVSGLVSVDEGVISKIDGTSIGNDIRLNAVVSSVESRGTVTLIKVVQLEDMDVVVFGNVSLNKGDYIEITGTIDEYEGSSQLLADKIVLK
jgi:DNA/RNA endonuclease YhcR with UshA esterase domain|tara:strand:- start:808 stop:1179 length:372 start_codon:yes stop_codon:yes gene_type:complete